MPCFLVHWLFTDANTTRPECVFHFFIDHIKCLTINRSCHLKIQSTIHFEMQEISYSLKFIGRFLKRMVKIQWVMKWWESEWGSSMTKCTWWGIINEGLVRNVIEKIYQNQRFLISLFSYIFLQISRNVFFQLWQTIKFIGCQKCCLICTKPMTSKCFAVFHPVQ